MKLWQGRFDGENDPVMERFNRSLDFDKRLVEEDIRGSLAYAEALFRAHLLSGTERKKMITGLKKLLAEADRLPFTAGDEDIHMAVERLLTERIGSAGKKLHTGRSRNEQVAVDTRLWLKKEIRILQTGMTLLMETVLERARRHPTLIMPAFTHLQAAQPVLFSHYMLSLFFMLERDWQRFDACRERADILPLGSGALCGSGFALDRRFLANALGFKRISDNSLDAVADRDYLAEFLSACAILMIHLSRYAEDLILFASPGYGFVELSDAYSTGSSMMPNKKNPDSLELVRGKSGRVIGHLVNILTVMKGLPLTYNKDLQEDKEALFSGADTVRDCLAVFSGTLATLTLNEKKIHASLDGELLATDLADCLVEAGLPFRDAHAVVGRIVREARKADKSLLQMTSRELQGYSPLFPKNYRPSFAHSIRRRSLYGGTGASSVAAQLRQAMTRLKKMKRVS